LVHPLVAQRQRGGDLPQRPAGLMQSPTLASRTIIGPCTSG
jgi:hypothetical protein